MAAPAAQPRPELVTALQARGRVPLNHDLIHRFFEVMAAGGPQVVFGGLM